MFNLKGGIGQIKIEISRERTTNTGLGVRFG